MITTGFEHMTLSLSASHFAIELMSQVERGSFIAHTSTFSSSPSNVSRSEDLKLVAQLISKRKSSLYIKFAGLEGIFQIFCSALE